MADEKKIDPQTQAHYDRLDDAWQRLSDNPNDETAREYILFSYIPLVEGAARKIYNKKPWLFEYEDLSQAGMVGLMQAMEKFDPKYGTKFSTFATRRVTGAILDEINSMDWTPRKIRQSIRKVMEAQEAYRKEHPGRSPSISEISTLTGLTEDEVRLALKGEPKTHVIAIDNESVSSIESHEGHQTLLTMSASRDNSKIETIVESAALQDLIYQTLKDECNATEEYIIIHHYYRHETLKSIAQTLSLSNAKVSEYKNNALKKLEEVLSPDDWYYEGYTENQS